MASSKPCPGCGKVDKYRQVKEVCSDCRDLISKGKLYRELIEKPDIEHLKIPGRSYMYPYADNDFRKAFDLLVRQLGEDAQPSGNLAGFPFSGKHDGAGWGYDYFTVRKGTTESLRQVYDLAVAWAGKARGEGHAEGRNLLRGLASGKITMGEFNRLAANRENI